MKWPCVSCHCHLVVSDSEGEGVQQEVVMLLSIALRTEKPLAGVYYGGDVMGR